MRAKEFINENKHANLPAEFAEPMHYTYELPGLSSSTFYPNYRLGVAMARARSEVLPDTENPYRPDWSEQSAVGPHAIVVGATDQVGQIIDKALSMTGIPGGKRLIASKESEEPPGTNSTSPVPSFKGYPRKRT